MTKVMTAVAALTFVMAALALDAPATYGARVTADEPQYLLTALSLAEDLDLDIADELADERFRAFHEVDLDPQTVDLDGAGQRLSPHDPLLPMLLAPAMGLGGWMAAKLALAAVAAATAAATVWLAVRRFGVAPGTAGVVTGALFVAPPLTSYATQVYPEMPAALATVLGVAAVTGPPSARARATAVLAITALPWLSVKYVSVAAVLALALLAPSLRRRGWWRGTGEVTTILALGLAGVAYLVVHQRIYGGWTAYAAGDHFVGGELQVVGPDPDYLGRSRRLIGLLVDRQFGLVAWTPAYLLLAPAVVMMIRRRIGGWPAVVGILGATWAVATWLALTMHGWWWPGRQLVVALPMAVVALAVAVDGRRRLRAGLVAGAVVGAAGWLWLVVEASAGRRTLVVDFAATTSPWYRVWSQLLPDHMAYGRADIVLTMVWSAILTALAAVAWRRAGPPSRAAAVSVVPPARRPTRDEPMTPAAPVTVTAGSTTPAGRRAPVGGGSAGG